MFKFQVSSFKEAPRGETPAQTRRHEGHGREGAPGTSTQHAPGRTDAGRTRVRDGHTSTRGDRLAPLMQERGTQARA